MTRARLFRNGQSHGLHLPGTLPLRGRAVFVRRVGNAVLLVPMADACTAFEAALHPFSADFLSERVQPVADERESF